MIFLRDWPFKLLALAMAVAAWIVVATRERGFVVGAVPIEFVGLGDDLILTGTPRTTAEVDVAVARWALSGYHPDLLRVRVDLSRIGEGDRAITLSADDVVLPAGVRVRHVVPPQLRLHVARVAETTLRVVPVVRGAPAPGHHVTDVRVEPINVQVKGPRSTIGKRDTVQTAPVDVGGRRTSVTRNVGLALPDSVSPVDDGRVQVTIDIQADRAATLGTEATPK